MKKFLIATSALVCLMGAPLAAQAATSASQSSSEMPKASKHATVRHHTAQRHTSTRHHTAMNKKNVSCPPGSQNAACQPSSTGAIH